VAVVTEQILELQEQDRRIVQGRRELADIPKRKDAIQAELEKHTEVLNEAKERQKSSQSSMGALELEVASAKEKVTKLRQQQLGLKTNKEFQAMESEIDAVCQEIRRLEDKQIEVMEQTEQIQREIREHSEALKVEESRIAQDTSVLDERLARIEADLGELQTKRDTLAADVDPRLLKHYERIFEKKQDYAIVGIEHGVCAGCHMKLPPHVLQDAKRNTEVVTCDFCGRMLYFRR